MQRYRLLLEFDAIDGVKYQSTKVLVICKRSEKQAKKPQNANEVERTNELWYFAKRLRGRPHTHQPCAYRNGKVVIARVALRLSEFGLMPVSLLCDEDLHLFCVPFIAHEDTATKAC
jgi:hypothetical protein